MSRVFDAIRRAETDGNDRFDVDASAQSMVDIAESLDSFPLQGPPDATLSPAAAVAQPRRGGSSQGRRTGNLIASPLYAHLNGLVQRIFLAPADPGQRVRSVMFTSVEGKQRSAELSAASAEILSGRVAGTVCLIDGNVSAPSLHRHFGLTNDVGIVQMLSGADPVRGYVTRVGERFHNSLWLLPTGSPSDPGHSLFTTPAGRNRLQELLGAFDYAVIDAPPVAQHPAASIIGAQVDGAVLIVAADVTRRQVVQAAANRLRASGVRVLGAVWSGRQSPMVDDTY
jgi:Mrp family chromosome partitioning ATPase